MDVRSGFCGIVRHTWTQVSISLSPMCSHVSFASMDCNLKTLCVCFSDPVCQKWTEMMHSQHAFTDRGLECHPIYCLLQFSFSRSPLSRSLAPVLSLSRPPYPSLLPSDSPRPLLCDPLSPLPGACCGTLGMNRPQAHLFESLRTSDEAEILAVTERLSMCCLFRRVRASV
eukprot:6203859-Pleurochrysis_carterae.AAC.1